MEVCVVDAQVVCRQLNFSDVGKQDSGPSCKCIIHSYPWHKTIMQVLLLILMPFLVRALSLSFLMMLPVLELSQHF